jgi:uncharacterized protein (TIGR01244 family)
MSDFRRVTDDYSVAPQITVDDVREAADQGFKLIINNRPEGEEPDQTPGGEIEAAARAVGLDYVAIPVRGGPTVEQAKAQRAAIEAAGGPVLAYCRSGNRCMHTWALGETLMGERQRDELLRMGAALGYDLRPTLG